MNLVKDTEESDVSVLPSIGVPRDQTLQTDGGLGLTTLRSLPRLDFTPTGIPDLDQLLGGGIPKGRIIETFGGEGCGKTSFALRCLAQAQQRGELTALIEPENALDPAYAEALGINLDDVLYSRPETGNAAINTIAALINRGVGIVVLDSVAALLPTLEDGSFYADTFAHALMLSQGLRYLNRELSKAPRPCTILFTNQLRFSGGSRSTPTGGQALSFFASLRLELRKSSRINQGKNPIGNKIKVSVVKNKCGGTPLQTTTIALISGKGLQSLGFGV